MAPGIADVLPLPTFTTKTPKKSTGTGPVALFHHSLVTDRFDALKFHAAASLQLDFGHGNREFATSDDYLISSPYNGPLHLLDMRTLDTPCQIFAKALTILKPVRDDYATAGYIESFNWQSVINLVQEISAAENYEWKEQSFYVVVFQSCLNADADMQLLHDLDSHSHEEATTSGGLLKYWFGSKNENHRNLATCLWRSREDARLGGTGPWHKQARIAARDLYAQIEFTTLKFVVADGAKDWSITDWDEKAAK